MSIQFFWRLPLRGDGRALNPDQWTRGDHGNVHPLRNAFARTGVRGTGLTYYDQLVQIARGAELTGFDGIHIPQSAAGEEPLIVAGSLAREVRRLTLTPALPPLLSAVYAAKIATSFQRLTGNRLALELTTLPDEPSPWHGRRWSQTEQIERIGEFIDVFKGFWTEPDFTYHGRYYEVEGGGFAGPLHGYPLPLFHLSGASEEAIALSGRHADVHIIPLASLDDVRQRIERVRAAAATHGRSPAFALQADIIARHSDEEAWAHVEHAWAEAGESGKVQREERLWPGFDRLRPGAGAALVGSHAALAETLGGYAGVGIDRFVLSANPHLEEAYRIGEHLLPLVRAALAAKAA
jgi:alkanesulfonate monooxygenase